MAAKRVSPDAVSTRPLLDKLGVKPGSKVAIVNLDDPGFKRRVKERTSDIVTRKPRSKVDLVFMGADDAADGDHAPGQLALNLGDVAGADGA